MSTTTCFAFQSGPQRHLGVLRVGRVVYVWRVPPVGSDLRAVRRLRLDRPGRRAPCSPVFGGDEDDVVPAAPRVQLDRLRRLQARAALFATPETLCSTEDVADVFGLRQGDVRAVRPETARRIGRAWMAPFGDWLRALRIDLEALADATEAKVRTGRVRATGAVPLRPLGGPGLARGAR